MGNGAKKSIVAKRGPVEREDDDGKNGFNDRSVFDGAAEGIATGARVFVRVVLYCFGVGEVRGKDDH